jgi:hypothetical protein
MPPKKRRDTKKGEPDGLTTREFDYIKSLRTSGNSVKGGKASGGDKKKEKRKPVPQSNGSKSGLLPDQPCSQIYAGLSKSGKSTLLARTLTDKKLMGSYWHTIVLWSPTADADTTISEALNLPDENIKTNFTEDDLLEVIDKQRELIKQKGYNKVAKSNRMCFIFDDCVSHQRFLRSQTMIDLCATVRHLLISVYFLMQSYRMCAKACRINFRGIAFFQSNRAETDVLCEEEGAPTLRSREFRELIHEATAEPYSFLFINKDRPYNQRYMASYDDILELQ